MNENLQEFGLISLTGKYYQRAIARMVGCNLSRGGIFDALIAQAVLDAVMDAILTLNPDEFTRLGEPIAQRGDLHGCGGSGSWAIQEVW